MGGRAARVRSARTRGVAAGRSAERACERSSDWRRGAAGSPDPDSLPCAGSPDPDSLPCAGSPDPNALHYRTVGKLSKLAVAQQLGELGEADAVLLGDLGGETDPARRVRDDAV